MGDEALVLAEGICFYGAHVFCLANLLSLV